MVIENMSVAVQGGVDLIALYSSEHVLPKSPSAVAERMGYMSGGGVNMFCLDLTQETLHPKQASSLILNTILNAPETHKLFSFKFKFGGKKSL